MRFLAVVIVVAFAVALLAVAAVRSWHIAKWHLHGVCGE